MPDRESKMLQEGARRWEKVRKDCEDLSMNANHAKFPDKLQNIQRMENKAENSMVTSRYHQSSGSNIKK